MPRFLKRAALPVRRCVRPVEVRELGLDFLDLRYAKLRVRDERRLRRLLVRMQEQGQGRPIWVVADTEPWRYVVIEGHALVETLKKLKQDVARAFVLAMPAAEALVTAYQLSRENGYNALEEGWLVHELHRVSGWSLGEVSVKMGRSKSWASQRLGLVESLPETVLEGVHSGKIGAYAATKILVPFARANRSDCERLVEKIGGEQLSSRQIEVLYRQYVAGDRRAARRIAEDPMRFLKAWEESRKGKLEPELSEAENRILNNLELIGNVSMGLARSMPQALGRDGDDIARGKIRSGWRRCAERFALLEKTAQPLLMGPAPAGEEAGTYAGQTNASGHIGAV